MSDEHDDELDAVFCWRCGDEVEKDRLDTLPDAATPTCLHCAPTAEDEAT